MGLTEELIDEGIENWRASGKFTDAEKIALEYSELMQFHPGKIDAAFYERLRAHYTDEQIVELGSYIGFNVGYHTFFRTLDFYPMFSPDGRLVSQEESREIYGAQPVSHLRGPMERAQAMAKDENGQTNGHSE
ncbi:MAG: hypothetical protein O2807_14525 [bacterium]|nr:hypothetical protein [bacterium]